MPFVLRVIVPSETGAMAAMWVQTHSLGPPGQRALSTGPKKAQPPAAPVLRGEPGTGLNPSEPRLPRWSDRLTKGTQPEKLVNDQ